MASASPPHPAPGSYRECVPAPALRPFVDRFWLRAPTGAAEVARVLPDGCMDLVVNLGTRPAAFVVGAMTRPLVLANAGDQPAVAVRFRPGAATPFLRVAAHQLTDQRVEDAALGIDWLSAQRLAEAGDPAVVLVAFERMLLGRLDGLPKGRAATPDPAVARAVRALLAARPPSIEGLARRLGWTRQHLGRVFRAEVGIGPKQLGRIARVQRAVAGLQADGRRAAEVAADAGYFDEAHMDRDFRALVGVSPHRVRGARDSIRPIASLFLGS